MPEEKMNVAATWADVLENNFAEGDVLVAEDDHFTEETVVETPIVETQTEQPVIETPAPVVETVAEQPPVTVTEKIVEKIVEKYPEMDEHSRQLFDAIQSGNEAQLHSYLQEKFRDYNTMSDHEVVKAGLKKDHPDWTDKRLDLEFKTKYDIGAKKDLTVIDQTLDPDGYDRAEAFNSAIDQREMLLEMQAEEYRIALNAGKKEIKLPKVESPASVQADTPTPEQLAEHTRNWEASVAAEVPKLTDLKFTVNGEEVVYKVTDEGRRELTDRMKTFNVGEYLSKRGWFDKDGNPNILRMTEDVSKLEDMGKIISSVATQIKTSAKLEVIAKDIKNIDTETTSRIIAEAPKKSWAEQAYAAGR